MITTIMNTTKYETNQVPANYEELYQVYFQSRTSLVKMLIRKMNRGIKDKDLLETLPHDVFVRCMEKNILAAFDASKGNFGGLLYSVCRTVSINARRHRKIDPLDSLNAGSLQVIDQDEGTFEPGVYDVDQVCPSTQDCTLSLESKQAVDDVVAFAREALKRGKTKRDQSLLALVSLLYKGESKKEIQLQLGVTDSTVDNWTHYLAGAIR